jgi:SAM-dependent methyltransferase
MGRPPREIYDGHAEEFDAATSLDELPDEFRDLLDTFVDAVPGPRILDAGCGPGRDVAYFRDRDLDPVGVDVARGMVEYARGERPGRYLLMDVRELGFRDREFDGVWCPATVFFLPPGEMGTALREFRRVLAPDGVARVGFKLGDGPVEDEKWGRTAMEYRVPEDSARELLETSGFAIESSSVTSLSSDTTFANFFCRQTAND